MSNNQPPRIMLEPHEHAFIMKLLHEHIPEGCEVYLFGSRTTGNARKYSDVDIALRNGDAKTDSPTMRKLRDAFEFSNFPYRVDIIDLNDIQKSFYDSIQNDLVML